MSGKHLLCTGFAFAIFSSPGCSPAVRFAGRVTIEGVQAPRPKHLYVSVSADPKVPAPTPTSEQQFSAVGPLSYSHVSVERSSLMYEMTMQGRRIELDAHFWYDTNGNVRLDVHDAVGRLTRVVGEDRGLCANLTEIPEVRLLPVVTLQAQCLRCE